MGIMICKSMGGWKRGQYDSLILKGRMDKRGHYDVQIKREDGQGTLWCANYEVDAKGGIMMFNLKRLMDK